MNKQLLLFSGIMIISVLMGGLSQVLLKISAGKTYDKWFKTYLNPHVIIAYSIFVLSTVCTVIAYRVVPLSMAPLWSSVSYMAVTAMSFFILKEHPSKKKMMGFIVITVGIVVFFL